MEKFVFGDIVRFIPTGERLVFIKTDKNGVNAKLVDADGKHRTACPEDLMGRETERAIEFIEDCIKDMATNDDYSIWYLRGLGELREAREYRLLTKGQYDELFKKLQDAETARRNGDSKTIS